MEAVSADALAGGMSVHVSPVGLALLPANFFSVTGGMLLAPAVPLALGAYFLRRRERAETSASASAQTPLEVVLGAGDFMTSRLRQSLALTGILGLLVVLLSGFTAFVLADLVQAVAQDPAATAARVRHSDALTLLPLAVPMIGALVSGTVYSFALSVAGTRAWSRRIQRVHEDQRRFLEETA